MGHDHHHDRARHGGGDGHFAPRHGAGFRPQDRHGAPAECWPIPMCARPISARRIPRSSRPLKPCPRERRHDQRPSRPPPPGHRTPAAALSRRSTPPCPTSPIHDTFPKLLALNAATYPDEVWLREKDLGIWNAYTWKQVSDRVQHMAWACWTWGGARRRDRAHRRQPSRMADGRDRHPRGGGPVAGASIAMRWRTRCPTSSPMPRCG